MIISYDWVADSTVTTGTGSITLSGNGYPGYQSFRVANIPSGSRVKYSIGSLDNLGRPTGDFEVGIGTYSSSGPTLSRDVVLASSNSGSLVSLGTGLKIVTIVADSSMINSHGLYLYGDGSDGDVSMSAGGPTLTRDMYYQNLTLSGTAQINTNGFAIYVSEILDISNAGANAINAAPINGNAGNPGSAGGAATVYPTALATLGFGSPGAAGARFCWRRL